jgi:hypothetical protein
MGSNNSKKMSNNNSSILMIVKSDDQNCISYLHKTLKIPKLDITINHEINLGNNLSKFGSLIYVLNLSKHSYEEKQFNDVKKYVTKNCKTLLILMANSTSEIKQEDVYMYRKVFNEIIFLYNV